MIDGIKTTFDENYDFESAQTQFEMLLKLAVSKLFESRVQGTMHVILDHIGSGEVTIDDVDLFDARDVVIEMIESEVADLFSGLVEE